MTNLASKPDHEISPNAPRPVPTKAPVSACVVEIGIRMTVANATVAAAAIATTANTPACPAASSGSNPYP